MIFAASGTTGFPFKRLLEAIEIISGSRLQEKIILQYSQPLDRIFPRRVRVVKFVPIKSMNLLFSTADVILTHAGFGSVLQAVKLGKRPPIVFPRLSKFGEHIDDHQLAFAKYLASRKLVHMLSKPEGILRLIKTAGASAHHEKIALMETGRFRLINYLTEITSKYGSK